MCRQYCLNIFCPVHRIQCRHVHQHVKGDRLDTSHRLYLDLLIHQPGQFQLRSQCSLSFSRVSRSYRSFAWFLFHWWTQKIRSLVLRALLLFTHLHLFRHPHVLCTHLLAHLIMFYFKGIVGLANGWTAHKLILRRKKQYCYDVAHRISPAVNIFV